MKESLPSWHCTSNQAVVVCRTEGNHSCKPQQLTAHLGGYIKVHLERLKHLANKRTNK